MKRANNEDLDLAARAITASLNSQREEQQRKFRERQEQKRAEAARRARCYGKILFWSQQ